MKKSHVPVLVVGAGAAGTMLMLELARRGVGARTIDRLPKAGETSKAITVHARTDQHFADRQDEERHDGPERPGGIELIRRVGAPPRAEKSREDRTPEVAPREHADDPRFRKQVQLHVVCMPALLAEERLGRGALQAIGHFVVRAKTGAG